MIVTIFTTISQKGDPVKISTKTRYGMRFMIDLAQSQGEGRVALKDIADRQGLSKKYLEQGRRASSPARIARRDARESGRLPSFLRCKCHHACRHRRRLRGRLGVARLHGVALCLRARRGLPVSSRVGRPSSGDRRLSFRLTLADVASSAAAANL